MRIAEDSTTMSLGTEGAERRRGRTNAKYGLKVYHVQDAAIVDIVFIHGLMGNREDTWTDKETEVFWPADLLGIDLPKSRILSFGYDADVAHFWSQVSQNRIADHASNLLNALGQLRERTDTDARPILFVAHSLGGLVFEDMLLASRNSAEEHLQQIIECTFGICFLGTPHCGSDLANWASVAGNVLNVVKSTNKSILDVLKTESEVLARIQQDFHTMLRTRHDRGLGDLKITCFFEELGIKGIGEVVPKHSAILPAYNHIGIRANHMDMAKFSDSDDPGYLAVSSELMRWSKIIERGHQGQHNTRSEWEESLLPGSAVLPGGGSPYLRPQITSSGRSGYQDNAMSQVPQTVKIQNVSGNGKIISGNYHFERDGFLNF